MKTIQTMLGGRRVPVIEVEGASTVEGDQLPALAGVVAHHRVEQCSTVHPSR